MVLVEANMSRNEDDFQVKLEIGRNDKFDELAAASLLLGNLPSDSETAKDSTNDSSLLDTLAELASSKSPIKQLRYSDKNDPAAVNGPGFAIQRRPRAQSEPWLSDNNWTVRPPFSPTSSMPSGLGVGVSPNSVSTALGNIGMMTSNSNNLGGIRIHSNSTTLPNISEKYADIYNKNGRIGIYTREERGAIINRFHEKRKKRVWKKKIRYHCRKNLADRRERVKGRFVKLNRDGEVVNSQTSPSSSNAGFDEVSDPSSRMRLEMLLRATEFDENEEEDEGYGDCEGEDERQPDDMDVDMEPSEDQINNNHNNISSSQFNSLKPSIVSYSKPVFSTRSSSQKQLPWKVGSGIVQKSSLKSEKQVAASLSTATTDTTKRSTRGPPKHPDATVVETFDDATLLARLSEPIKCEAGGEGGEVDSKPSSVTNGTKRPRRYSIAY